MALNSHIGIQIRKARRMSGLTQKELGKKIGKSGATIAYLEQGKRRVSPDVLQAVAEITGHHLSFFYEEKESVDNQLMKRFDFLKDQIEEMASQLGNNGDERDFSLVFEEAADAMVLVDLKGKILALNKKQEDLLGWTREEVLGRPFYKFSFFSLKKMPQLIKLFHSVIKSQKVYDTVKMPLKTAQGKTIETDIHSSLLRRDGKVWAMMSVVRPVESVSVVIDELL
jgi:PAS domain S-box-containing protein